jgi:hypothetical protein
MRHVVIKEEDRRANGVVMDSEAFFNLLRRKPTPKSLLDALIEHHDLLAGKQDVTWGQTVIRKLRKAEHVMLLIEALVANKMRDRERPLEEVTREVIKGLREVWSRNRNEITSRMWDAVLKHQERTLGLS